MQQSHIGRHYGNLTLRTAVAGDIEYVAKPEIEFIEADLIGQIKPGIKRKVKNT